MRQLFVFFYNFIFIFKPTDPCDKHCDESKGCWGPSSTQCVECRDYSDNTDENGSYTEAWITDDNGDIWPGYNVTTCVQECNASKG